MPTDQDRLLDAAEKLFYERGYQAVGMDALREASGLPLKRIYALYGGKDAIAVAMLDRRDLRWRHALAAHASHDPEPAHRPLAIFDWLETWLATDGHRGCAWINAYGELGSTSPAIADAVREHKARVREYVADIVEAAGGTPETAHSISLLLEGAMVTAGITGDPSAARHARHAAATLLQS
ncbi:TetR/AcrR family transcriptional regulator [Demequina sp. B12]|uniref:TetR/AcrR family transcriptional regulator n=1 Tax=Demequina sp. B12 TaxID=2992757 RepID=UPI00237B5663|nr:TetR/AcrR family transcriptional regulator [Demequina sp. B12]MDE0572038.1 TetR/AcrR family transcriptional regulator [Demequina sp. B12]